MIRLGEYDMEYFSEIKDAIEAFKKGRMIIVVDGHDRENEGDLVVAAEHATPEAINFMVTHGKGLVCIAVSKEIAERLELKPVEKSKDRFETAFLTSIDHKDTSTGISAFDRSLTIRKAADENSKPSDFFRPGHVFPLLAKGKGVLERPGHTEAAVDLARIAGMKTAGVICEMLHEDGHMMRLPELVGFAEKHKLKIINIGQIAGYRRKLGL